MQNAYTDFFQHTNSTRTKYQRHFKDTGNAMNCIYKYIPCSLFSQAIWLFQRSWGIVMKAFMILALLGKIHNLAVMLTMHVLSISRVILQCFILCNSVSI